MSCFRDPEKKRHHYFSAKIAEKRDFTSTHHRIILIGSGSAGKSTFLKQLKLLSSRDKTFDTGYRLKFRNIVYCNLVDILDATLKFMEREKIKLSNEDQLNPHKEQIYKFAEKIQKEADNVASLLETNNSRKFFFDVIEHFSVDSNLLETLKRGNEYNCSGNPVHFLSQVDTIRDVNYVPSDDDVLKCRSKTLCIFSETITYKTVTFEVFDVGGQRDQRCTWVEALCEGGTAVIFLVDVSAYDQNLAEDHTTNEIREAVSLLEEVWNKSFLSDKSIILFLNKQDLLEQKIRKGNSNVEKYFPDYKFDKSRYVCELLNDYHEWMNKQPTKRKNDSFLPHNFSYFLPTFDDIRTKNLTANDKLRLKEFDEIKEVLNVAESEGVIEEVLKFIDEQPIKNRKMYANLCGTNAKYFNLQNVLFCVPLLEIVCVSNFFQDLLMANCRQTLMRNIYPFPTTAIDKRNIDRVFNSCQNIVQGKMLAKIMN